MKYISFLLISLAVFSISTPLTYAQTSGAGCYITVSGQLEKVGVPDINNHCTQGTPMTANGQGGTIVSNNLTYTQLEPIPGENATHTDFCGLINLIFKALIYLGGMIAVLFLVLGGINYMVSEVVSKKIKARERVQAAIYGLLIILCSWIILNTINPQLVSACSVLNPTVSGIVQSQTSIDAQNGLAAAQARAQCENNSHSTFYLLPNGATCSTAGTYNSSTAICEDISPGQVCITPFVPFSSGR